MKRRLALLGLTLLVSAPFASGAEKPFTPAAPAVTPKGGAVLEVATLLKHVDRYKGPLRVEGLVRKVFFREKMLGLIDAAEFKKCGMVSACCESQMLPVQWSGAMPEVKSLVRLEGEVRRVGDKLEFVAKSLEKVPVK